MVGWVVGWVCGVWKVEDVDSGGSSSSFLGIVCLRCGNSWFVWGCIGCGYD